VLVLLLEIRGKRIEDEEDSRTFVGNFVGNLAGNRPNSTKFSTKFSTKVRSVGFWDRL